MKILYAPWRTRYASSVNSSSKSADAPRDACVFCSQLAEQKDNENFILKRFNSTYVMLNKFPYNAGHLLVLPLEHAATLDALPQETRHELMEVTNAALNIAQEQLHPEGFNIGINLGIAAGAGIPAHLHTHIVPRWQRDTNFMPVVADTRVISFDLHELYQKLQPAFEKVEL